MAITAKIRQINFSFESVNVTVDFYNPDLFLSRSYNFMNADDIKNDNLITFVSNEISNLSKLYENVDNLQIILNKSINADGIQ